MLVSDWCFTRCQLVQLVCYAAWPKHQVCWLVLCVLQHISWYQLPQGDYQEWRPVSGLGSWLAMCICSKECVDFDCCRNVVKSFYTAGMLFDVLSTFGELSEDVSENMLYSNEKQNQIFKRSKKMMKTLSFICSCGNKRKKSEITILDAATSLWLWELPKVQHCRNCVWNREMIIFLLFIIVSRCSNFLPGLLKTEVFFNLKVLDMCIHMVDASV